ncbi:MAG: O-antigen ligase family protein [Caldilineaceae bacterium]
MDTRNLLTFAHRRDQRSDTAWRAELRRILWVEPFWIALLAPSLLFPGRFWVTELQPLWVLLLFAFWPLRLLAGLATRRSSWRRTPLDLAVAALLAVVAAALALSPAPASSYEAAGYLLLGVAAANALVQWPPLQARPARTAWLLLLVGAAVALVGPLLLGARGDKLGLGFLLPAAGGWGESLGETVNPNVLGGALLAPLLLALALAVGPRWSRQPWRWVWGAFALALAAELLLTECRGAWLGAAVGVAVILLLRWPASGWLLAPLALLAAAGLLAAGGLSLAFDALGGAGGGRAGQGLADRMAIWQAALTAIGQQPWRGLGLGLFGPWVTQHGLLAGLGTWQPHAHNLLLQVAADLGLPGLAVYGALLLAALATLVGLLRARPAHKRGHGRHRSGSAPASPAARPPAPTQRMAAADVYRLRLHWTLAVGSAAALAALLAHGLVDAALWGDKVAFLPWLLLALVCLLAG